MSDNRLEIRRIRILSAMIVLIMATFAIRLYYLQVIQHDYYVEQANDEQLKRLVIPAQRGEIYAMNGTEPVKLVMNGTVYTVFADPPLVKNRSATADALREIVGGNLRPGFEKLMERKDSRYQVLATDVSRTQAEMLKGKRLQGIGFQAVTKRIYPEGQLASQVLGFVDNSGVGRYGVESYLNSRLTGRDGLLQAVTDVSNVPLSIGGRNINIPPKNGEDVVLSIDRNVQAYAEQALANGLKRTGASNGSVLVMDPSTGRVMAMANLPTFSPASLDKVNDLAVFNNDTISSPYEPGSDIKTLTMSVGLDKGVIRPDSTYVNTDSIQVGDRTISNATKGQIGTITMQHALNYSLNTGMVTVAQRLGDGRQITREARETMHQYFHDRFGLGSLTGIELANEARGIVISPDDIDGNAVRYSNMSFGQGMDVTMLQVASAFSALMNGGTYYQPTVIAGHMDGDGQFQPNAPHIKRARVVSPQTSTDIKAMVHEARQAFYAQNDRPNYYIGGKTGTSQTLRDGHYVDDETIGTYLGFGGAYDEVPKYVIMVRVSGRNMKLSGGTDAMPIFTDISNWLLDYLKVKPKN